MTGKFLPNYVEAVFASRRLPPKAAVSACSRHSFVEGIRNGGLDVTQNRRSTLKIHYGCTKLPALQRFFLSSSVGAGSLGIFSLVLLLVDCFFTEQLITAGVDPKTAEADACRIEHIISDESFSRLKEAAAQEQE